MGQVLRAARRFRPVGKTQQLSNLEQAKAQLALAEKTRATKLVLKEKGYATQATVNEVESTYQVTASRQRACYRGADRRCPQGVGRRRRARADAGFCRRAQRQPRREGLPSTASCFTIVDRARWRSRP